MLIGNILCFCGKKKDELEAKNKTIHYCYRVPDAYIVDELNLYKAEKDSGTLDENSIFVKLRNLRCSLYATKYEKMETNPNYAKIPIFNTLPSYDYRLHPTLKELFMER